MMMMMVKRMLKHFFFTFVVQEVISQLLRLINVWYFIPWIWCHSLHLMQGIY